MRDITNLWAHSSTIECALRGCTTCSYKIIVKPPVDTFPTCRRNERPEQCLRLKKEGAKHSPNENVFVQDMLQLERILPKFSLLVVGDGNFSFSNSLFPQLSSTFKEANLICSCYFNKEELLNIYPDAKLNIASLEQVERVQVLYEVDATCLKSKFEDIDVKFDAIIFNFPCIEANIGQDAQDENIEANQALVKSFLKSSEDVLKENGVVLITHKTKEPFCWWNINTLVEEQSTLSFQKACIFDRSWFPTYKPRKVKFVSKGKNKNSFPVGDAVIFVFANFDMKKDNDLEDGLWNLDKVAENNFLKVNKSRVEQIIRLLQLTAGKKKVRKRKWSA